MLVVVGPAGFWWYERLLQLLICFSSCGVGNLTRRWNNGESVTNAPHNCCVSCRYTKRKKSLGLPTSRRIFWLFLPLRDWRQSVIQTRLATIRFLQLPYVEGQCGTFIKKMMPTDVWQSGRLWSVPRFIFWWRERVKSWCSAWLVGRPQVFYSCPTSWSSHLYLLSFSDVFYPTPPVTCLWIIKREHIITTSGTIM